MKKICLVTTFLVLALSVIFSVKINAAPAPPWQEVLSCGTNGFSVKKLSSVVPVDDMSNFLNAHPSMCVVSNKIGYVTDSDKDNLVICRYGFTIPSDPDKPSEKISDSRGCCPTKQPYTYLGQNGTLFCSTATITFDRKNVTDCSAGSGSYSCPDKCEGGISNKNCTQRKISFPVSIDMKFYFLAGASNLDYFYNPTTTYMCSSPNCFTSKGFAVNGLSRKERTETEISGDFLACVVEKTESSGKICISGEWLDAAELKKYEGNMSSYYACNAYVDTNIKTTCLTCIENCPTCVWSDAGCFDTTQNGMIIRIFQIGLGIVGGLGILRFFQAALLRQTSDPTKIQESYDILTSLIMGIVLLLGSIVLLRYLSIDVLQLLPTNFLK